MLRWLEPENGEREGQTDDRRLIKRIRRKVIEDDLSSRIEAISKSRTAGIWRIKRAKIILGSVEGKKVQKMVTDLRVPPDSIVKCQNNFLNRGMDYFKIPDRSPTSREVKVEEMLHFLESPPSKQSPRWRTVRVRYIGHDFTACQIQQLRELISSRPDANPNELGRQTCQLFNLYQSDGKYKLTQTKDIMKRMDMDNVITLPRVMRRPNPKRGPRKKAQPDKHAALFDQTPEELNINAVRNLQFIPVYSKQDSLLWREMIERFHYIKTTRLFGAQLRYLVYGDEALMGTLDLIKPGSIDRQHWAKRYDEVKRGKHLLASLGFSSSSWRLSSRETPTTDSYQSHCPFTSNDRP